MNILIGFERSGVIRDSFASRGHFAWSCDIELSRSNNQSRLASHLHCDIYQALDYRPWDLIILHPMCTALTLAGNKWYGKGKPKHDERLDAIKYTQDLWDYAISICDHVCLENPVSVLSTQTTLPKPQYIQPYQFGHKEQKKTALFLYGLPELQETNNVYDEMMLLPKNERERLHYLPPSEYRAEIRSRTFQGIANAMVNQWG